MKLRDLLKGTPAHPPFVPSPDPRCAAVTRSGARCRLPHIAGSDRCAVHQAKAA